MISKAGSSPLTRGKPTVRGRRRRSRLAHPRSRGENTWVATHTGLPSGSSPLTRGKLDVLRHRLRRRRLIPAHAGKTRTASRPQSCARAHPRSRGENLVPAGRMVIGGGSSPLTRGKPPSLAILSTESGLIPAHAGKTSPTPTMMMPAWAHPRSRGENPATRPRYLCRSGSSPLTRGKPRSMIWASIGSGLIPAHAGKTGNPGDRGADDAAHPRSRGENVTSITPSTV